MIASTIINWAGKSLRKGAGAVKATEFIPGDPEFTVTKEDRVGKIRDALMGLVERKG